MLAIKYSILGEWQMKRKIILSIILLMSIVFLSGCTVPQLMNFEYTGDKDPVAVPKGTYTTVILDFQLGVGSIILVVDPTATDLVNVENKVSIREGSGGSLAEAKEVSSSEISSETMKIQFDSQDEGLQVDYSYAITITVANNITLQINLAAATGGISASISDATITINKLDLETTTGEISLTLGVVQFSDLSPRVKTSTGTQDITIEDVIYTSSTDWSISATTGPLYLDIIDILTPGNVSKTQKFDIGGTTGSISVIADLHQDYGLKITASTTTGDITIPGGGESYTSTNYNSAIQKYDFDLGTSTGDITYSTGS